MEIDGKASGLGDEAEASKTTSFTPASPFAAPFKVAAIKGMDSTAALSDPLAACDVTGGGRTRFLGVPHIQFVSDPVASATLWLTYINMMVEITIFKDLHLVPSGRTIRMPFVSPANQK